jgi:two-component system sensor histidine kinase KdpD
MSIPGWTNPPETQRLSWIEVQPLVPSLIAVLLMGAFLEPLIGHLAVGIFFLILISISGLIIKRFSLLLLTAALLGLCYHYLLFPPIFSFYVYKAEDLKTVVALYVAAMIVGGLIQKLRRQATTLKVREETTRLHYVLARQLAQTQSLEEVAHIACSTLSRLLNQTIALYLLKKDERHPLLVWHPSSSLQEYDLDREQLEVFAIQHDISFQLRNTRSARSFFPLIGREGLVGIILVSRKLMFEERQDKLRMLETFMSQIAVAIEREILHERSKQLEVMEQTQKLYRTLLNSVSHELKTPLVAITGSASAMLDADTMRDPTVGPLLAQEILTASHRLRHVVDNLLEMSRVDSGMLRPKRKNCDMRDIIAISMHKLQIEGYQNPIELTVAPDTPEIDADPVLIEQALFNIIQNAHNYTQPGSKIEIHVWSESGQVLSSIRDRGPGLPTTDPNQVFAKFFRGSPQNPGGLGLGLSIVQGFIEAHGGTIAADNHPDGGAMFTISLPAWRYSV